MPLSCNPTNFVTSCIYLNPKVISDTDEDTDKDGCTVET